MLKSHRTFKKIKPRIRKIRFINNYSFIFLKAVLEAIFVAKLVKGFMIESYIEDGCQKIGEGVYGKSITDPCLGWEKTEKLIYDIAEKI